MEAAAPLPFHHSVNIGTSFGSPATAGVLALCVHTGRCDTSNPAHNLRTLVDDTRAYTNRNPRHGFFGDPHSPIPGHYYGPSSQPTATDDEHLAPIVWRPLCDRPGTPAEGGALHHMQVLDDYGLGPALADAADRTAAAVPKAVGGGAETLAPFHDVLFARGDLGLLMIGAFGTSAYVMTAKTRRRQGLKARMERYPAVRGIKIPSEV